MVSESTSPYGHPDGGENAAPEESPDSSPLMAFIEDIPHHDGATHLSTPIEDIVEGPRPHIEEGRVHIVELVGIEEIGGEARRGEEEHTPIDEKLGDLDEFTEQSREERRVRSRWERFVTGVGSHAGTIVSYYRIRVR